MNSFLPKPDSNLNTQQAKRFALLAVSLTLIQVIPVSLAFILKSKVLLIIAVLFLHWGTPFIAALWIEKRSIHSLGLVLKKEKIITYLLYAVSGYVILIIIHIGERYLLINMAPESIEELTPRENYLAGFLIQLGFVGLPEEFFYRGYIQTRLCEWLGGLHGWLATSAFFGLVHVFSRLMAQGPGYILPAVVIGFTAFLGGLMFGYLYAKTKSIIPPAFVHIFLNLTPPLLFFT